MTAEVNRAIELAPEVKSHLGPGDTGWAVLADADGDHFSICSE